MMEVEKVCPKCGHRMYVVNGSDWSLFEVHKHMVRCDNCGHVETVTVIVAERLERP